MYKRLLVAALLTLVPFAFAGARQVGIERKVEAAVESARKGDQGPVALLKKDPELAKAMPYLRRFLTDPNRSVKSAVFALASGVHTADAVGLLTELMKEDEGRWSEASVKVFYGDYDCAELRGGGGLRDNLADFAKNGRGFSIGKAMLLLSCFKGDEKAAQALESLSKGQRRRVSLDWSRTVDVAFAADIALAELGRADAADRVVRRVGVGEVNDLIFAFDTIRFVNRKDVLAALVEKLNDKRKAVYPWSDDFYLRVSDIALNALARKSQKPVGVEVKSNYRYTDRELNEAYSSLKARF